MLQLFEACQLAWAGTGGGGGQWYYLLVPACLLGPLCHCAVCSRRVSIPVGGCRKRIVGTDFIRELQNMVYELLSCTGYGPDGMTAELWLLLLPAISMSSVLVCVLLIAMLRVVRAWQQWHCV